MEETTNNYKQRIKLLNEFISLLHEYLNQNTNNTEKAKIKSKINKNIIAVRSIVNDAGTNVRMVLSPPRIVGGPVAKNIDPFDMIFESWYGESFIPKIIEIIEQAIGVYENLYRNTGFINLSKHEVIDIENAINRALRPSFREKQPSSEIEVQDAIENILNSIGISFSREKENSVVGQRAFIPDFVVNDLDLAIEVKLATQKHDTSAIQEEITSDITAYKTKWKHILFIIYDNGVIIDPYKFRLENMKLFGVSVIVIKH